MCIIHDSVLNLCHLYARLLNSSKYSLFDAMLELWIISISDFRKEKNDREKTARADKRRGTDARWQHLRAQSILRSRALERAARARERLSKREERRGEARAETQAEAEAEAESLGRGGNLERWETSDNARTFARSLTSTGKIFGKSCAARSSGGGGGEMQINRALAAAA